MDPRVKPGDDNEKIEGQSANMAIQPTPYSISRGIWRSSTARG